MFWSKGAESRYFLVEAHRGAGVTAWLKESEGERRKKTLTRGLTAIRKSKNYAFGIPGAEPNCPVSLSGPRLRRGWGAIQR